MPVGLDWKLRFLFLLILQGYCFDLMNTFVFLFPFSLFLESVLPLTFLCQNRCCAGITELWWTLWSGRVISGPWCWLARLFQLRGLRFSPVVGNLPTTHQFRTDHRVVWWYVMSCLSVFLSTRSNGRNPRFGYYATFCGRFVYVLAVPPLAARASTYQKVGMGSLI